MYLAGLKRYDCSRVETVLYFVLTSILTASLRDALYSFCTFVVIVAENKKVLRDLGS